MSNDDYSRVERALAYVQEQREQQPQLADVAAAAQLSEHHLQRVFKRWAGISPKRFLQFLTVEHARRQLESGGNLLDATYATGLSSPSRLHDLFVIAGGITPGEYQTRGAGLKLAYGIGETPFGDALIASSERGICELHFCSAAEFDSVVAVVASRWPEASMYRDDRSAAASLEQIFATWPGATPGCGLHLRGSNFQLRVWEALLRLPAASLISYSELAVGIGKARAHRAVASAVAANHLAMLIPCHRVIRRDLRFGEYRWGQPRKLALLGWESAQTLSPEG